MKWIKQIIIVCILSGYCSFAFAYGNAVNTWNNAGSPPPESFIEVGNANPGLGGQAGMTVTAWVKWNRNPVADGSGTTPDQWANIISNNSHTTSDQGQFWLQHSQTNALFEFAVTGNSRAYVQSTTQPQEGVWYHVVGVYDSTQTGNTLATRRVKIYINGILEASNNNVSGNISAHIAAYFLKIGRWSLASERHFDGDIDEVSLWNRALSEDEIRSWMTKKIIPGLLAPGLIGYWNLDEVSGGLANDLSTANRDGNVFGETLTATSGTATTLTDTSRSWTLNQWAGHKVGIINNTGYGQVRDIVSNTATTLTVSSPWAPNPAVNSKYSITVFDRFTCSDAPIGDANVYDYNITSLDTLSFTYAHGAVNEVFSAQNITGLPKAVHIYRVDQPPNFTTSTSPGILNFDVSPYYWGVHVIGGTAPGYTVQYTYTGHPQVTVSNESGLILAHRSANCATPWTDLAAALNTGADTLSQTGQSGGEYILGVPMGSATDFIVYKLVTDENGGNPETGDILLYTIVIQKPNAASLANAVFTDATPTGTTYVPDSASAPLGSTIVTEDPLSISGINVPDHGQVNITFRVTITGGSGTTISNQGDLYYDSNADGSNDAHQLSNAASVTVAAPSTPNFDQTVKSVDLVDDVNLNGAINAGDTLRYAVKICNTGDADAGGVTFSDNIPANTSYVSGTATASSGVIVDNDPAGPITWSGNVAAGMLKCVTITFDVTVNGAVPDGTVISNQGAMTYGAATTLTDGDPFLPGKQATDVIVATMPRGVAVKNVTDENGGNVEADDYLLYTIDFDNFTTLGVNGLVLTDAIPNNTSYVAGSATVPTGCVIESETPVLVISNIDMPGHSKKTFTFRVQVDNPPRPGVNQILNQGTVFYDSDGDGTNDATQLTDGDTSQFGNQPTIIAVHGGPNFDQTTKSVAFAPLPLVGDADGNGVVTPGDILRYNIKLKNTGTLNATGVVFHDPAPPFHTGSLSNWNASGGSVIYNGGTGQVEWTGNVSAGATIVIEFDVVVGIAPLETVISNQGIVYYDSDGDSVNDSAMLTDGNPVEPGRQPTDVSIGGFAHAYGLKTVTEVNGVAYVPGDPVEPGDTVEYTIYIENQSGFNGNGVELWDPIPNNTNYVTGSVTATSGSVSYDGVTNQVEWTGNIPAHSDLTITFEVELDNPMAAGVTQISNQATAFYDSNTDGINDTYQSTDGDSTQVGNQPTVLNLSAGTISGTVFDDLDTDGNFDSPGEPGIPGVAVDLYVYNTLTSLYDLLYGTFTDIDGYYEFTGLPADDYRVVETNLPYYVSWLPPPPEPSSIDVTLASGGAETVNFGDHPNGDADLSVTKTCETMVANGTEQLAYIITVTNIGPDTADVTLTDDFTALIAAGLSDVKYTIDGVGAPIAWPGYLTWNAMLMNDSHEIRIFATVATTFLPEDNIATVASNIFDPVVGDNAAICMTQVCPDVRTAVKFENPSCTACSADCPDYEGSVEITNTVGSLDLGAAGTIEAWIQATSCTASDADAGIVAKGTAGSFGYGFGLSGGGAGSVFGSGVAGETAQTIGFRVGDTILVAIGRTLTPGKWYHVACAWDSPGMKIYINGIEEASNGTGASDVAGGNLLIGKQEISATPVQYYGVVEEFRVWDIARSQADIQADMCRTFTLSTIPDPDLKCYLKYNECDDDVAVDASGNGNNGDMSSAFRVCSEAPVGDEAATPDYVGAAYSEYSTSLISTAGETLTVTGDGGTWSHTPATSPPYKSGLQVYRVNGPPEPANGPLNTSLFGDRGYWGVFVTGGDAPTYSVTYTYDPAGIGDEDNLDLMYRHHGCGPWMNLDGSYDALGVWHPIDRDTDLNTLTQSFMSGTEFILGTDLPPRNAILFDGSNDFVDVADDTSLDLTTDGTLEAWIYISTIQSARIIYKVDTSGANPDGYSLGINASGNVLFSLYESGGPSFTTVTSTTVLSTGIWYHIAGTWDNGDLMHLYINGVLDMSSAAAQISGNPSGINLTIGGDGATGFQGQIDEVRVWNAARTQTDIRNTMCKKVTNLDSGFVYLMGYWRFDDETGSATCPDYTSNDNDGIMSGLGADPSDDIRDARVCSAAPIGDDSNYGYYDGGTLSPVTAQLAAKLPDTDYMVASESTVTITDDWTDTFSGLHIYRVDEAPVYPPDRWEDDYYDYQSPNGLTPPDLWSSIDYYRYWGVFVTDWDPSNTRIPTYELVYHYAGNPMVPDDDSVLGLARRPEYCFGTWTDSGDTPDYPNDTLTITADYQFATATADATNPEYVLGGDNDPLAITLSSFTATADNGCVEIAWETATEINTAGFYVWRSDNPLVGFVRVTGSMIASTSEMETMGAKYAFKDCGVDFSNGKKYYYMLEEIEIDHEGSGNMHGPIGPVSETVTAAQTSGGSDSKACFIGTAWGN